ncbi:MAG: protoporphyrinogen oxidase [Blastocatellia bacterium]|nr:protoporphyrinogen oxidase [Blastocatellia bacterium]
MRNKRDVIIIGAGVSGLACAYRLKRLGIDALLLESSLRAGGVIRSEVVDGFLIERGPNSSQGTEELLALVEELGITDELIEGDPKAPAYVYFDGRLHPVPAGPASFFKSRLFSTTGKLRLLKEFFVPPRTEETEESVASFARRRIGPEAADRLVAPFVSGIYAGDAEQLSVQAAFPRLANLERDYGGLFRGMMAKAKEARRAKKAARDVMDKATPTRRRSVSFRQGMAFLTETLRSRIGEELITGCADCRLQNIESEIPNSQSGASITEGDNRFAVSFDRSGHREQIRSKHLVIAAPAHVASGLVAPLSDELSRLLEEIRYAELAIIHLAYDVSAIRTPLDGFGFLVAPGEELSILGCVWNSSLFEGRAPEGKSLLTVFIGGAREPRSSARLKDAELISTVHTDLQRALGIIAPPQTIAITRYERAIPQYNLGHAARVCSIENLLQRMPGLYLAGNYLHGVSTGDCIKEADRVAREIARAIL